MNKQATGLVESNFIIVILLFKQVYLFNLHCSLDRLNFALKPKSNQFMHIRYPFYGVSKSKVVTCFRLNSVKERETSKWISKEFSSFLHLFYWDFVDPRETSCLRHVRQSRRRMWKYEVFNSLLFFPYHVDDFYIIHILVCIKGCPILTITNAIIPPIVQPCASPPI